MTIPTVLPLLIANQACPFCEFEGPLERCRHCGEFFCIECMKDHVKFILDPEP
jgi:hypothetical protein